MYIHECLLDAPIIRYILPLGVFPIQVSCLVIHLHAVVLELIYLLHMYNVHI